MKRTFDQMSSMDLGSSGFEVTRGAKRKRRRITPGRGGKGPKLSSRQKNEVKNILHRAQELKYVTFNSGVGTQISTTMSISQVPFQISQGTTDTTRIGDTIMYAGDLQLRLQIVNGSGATADVYNNMRVVIFQWHPTSTPVSTSVFLAGPSTAVDIYSIYNHDERQNYNVIFDKVFKTVGNANAATTPNTSILTTGVLEFQISLKNCRKHVQYQGGTTTGTNLFYIALVSDSALATHPSITYVTKLFYRDS